MPETVNQRLVSNKTDAFRRLSIKRRLYAPTDMNTQYETNWYDISDYVISLGNVRWTVDDIKYSFVKPEGVSLVCDNNRGVFDPETNQASFWNGYLTRYKTLVRLEAGFIEPNTTTEIPPANLTSNASTSTQFIGVLNEPIVTSDENQVVLNVKSLASVLEDSPANSLIVASVGAIGAGKLTASDLMTRMRDATDGSSNFIFRPLITSTVWSLTATTNTLTAIDTSTVLDNFSCWDLGVKLAEAQNFGLWITKIGGVNFNPKTDILSSGFEFSGRGYQDNTYGHTIK